MARLSVRGREIPGSSPGCPTIHTLPNLANKVEEVVMPFTYDFEMPAVTVDALILRHKSGASLPEALDAKTEILLIKRKNDPYKGMWAFPGGFVDKFEDPVHACHREVKEETSIELPNTVKLFTAKGDEGRDPRGWTISLAYYTDVPWDTKAAPSDDAIEIGWFNILDLPPMAFDHRAVFTRFLCRHPK